MTEIVSIQKPDRLHIQGSDGQRFYGADQDWYPTKRQRLSGCGPTTCANAFFYLARASKSMRGLCLHDASTQSGMQRLMEDAWHYITPGLGGVNKLSMLMDGAVRYGADRGVPITPKALEIPAFLSRRPSLSSVLSFLCESFHGDAPVAFLNLSNGAVSNLESWHWVTLVSINPSLGTALMYDQGNCGTVDLGLWLRSSALGGGLVSLA